MVDALENISRVIAFNDKANAIRQHLLSSTDIGISEDQKPDITDGTIEQIKPDPGLEGKAFRIAEEIGSDNTAKKIIYLRPDQFRIIKQIALSNDSSATPSATHSYEEPTGIIKGLTQEEQKIHEAVQAVNDILRRAAGRTTSFTSLIISWFLGFDERGYSPYDAILKDPKFTLKFSKYLTLIKSGKKADAKDYIQTAFEGEDNAGQKQKITVLAGRIIRLSDFLPRGIINHLPLAFCIQNIVIPFMLRWFKEGTVKNILSFVRGLNPWLDEGAFAHMGIYKSETLDIKDKMDLIFHGSETNRNHLPVHSVDNCGAIELSNLTSDEHGFKNVLGEVHDASQRLFGRGNNLSSLLARFLFWASGMGNFQKFAGITLKKDSFVKKLYQYLSEVSTSAESKTEGSPEPASAFDKKEERVVAYTVPKMVSVINSLDQSHVDKINSATNWFGRVYSVQYLLMPILTAIVGEKGFIGKTLGVIRDINPILNDAFFDLVATFREELLSIFDIVSNSANIKKLFGEIPIKKGMWRAFENFQSLLSTARGYGHELYNRAAEAFSGSAQPSA